MTHNCFQYQFHVSLHETDAAGVLFFAHLFRHAHDTYERFMGEIGFRLSKILADGAFHLPLVHSEADFLHPIRHDDEVQVCLWVEELGRSSFTIIYRFLDGEGGVLAHAKTRHVAVGRTSGVSIPINEELRSALASYQAPLSQSTLSQPTPAGPCDRACQAGSGAGYPPK